MADKDGMERKVFLLPSELMERVRVYQRTEGLPSEVETARRLINIGLQIQEDMSDILSQIRDGYRTDKNIRSLVNRLLSHHILLQAIQYGESEIIFELKSGAKGRVAKDGSTYHLKGNRWEIDEDDIPF